jgi:ATP-dependent DNA helicase RecQ
MDEKSQLLNALKKHFNYSDFRVGQQEIIHDIMQGKDVLGILPTGSGKSICYQLPSILLEGITIVVSPLISLMIDQVKQLKAINFKSVVALNSFMDPMERKRVYQQLHTYKLVYVSPELLQHGDLLMALDKIKVSLFVIDEAHCISQWGHEFRPDYLKLDTTIARFNYPTTLALSATATKHVQTDIISALHKPHISKQIYPMDRPNIAFNVVEVQGDQEKISIITDLLKQYQVPVLIYFSSRRIAEQIAALLSEMIPEKRIAFYHGGMEQMDRIAIQQQFMNNQLDIICCTSAFGMGINKNNIRLVIHYHFPLQIESFIQETGRAGRDGKESVSLLFMSPHDIHLPVQIIKNELPTENQLLYVFKQLANLYHSGETLPKLDKQIESLFDINETQWRFLHYQFEKHDMIIQQRICYQEEIWGKAFQKIKTLIKQRSTIKEQKLTEMLDWIQQKQCLRHHLYKNFQANYKRSTAQCCSNCGFSWWKWTPEQTDIDLNIPLTWENKLKHLLLIGEENGSK